MELKDLTLELYDYLDFRALMGDYFEACRTRDAKYSMRYFAKRLGFGSPNYIQRILAGDRALSEAAMDRAAEEMGLRGPEREYFELLVRYGQAQDLKRRTQYFEQVNAIRRRKLKVTTLDEAQYQCVSGWLHWVVREMSFTRADLENVQAIARSLKSRESAAAIAQSLADLEAAGLLVRGGDGRLRAADNAVNFPDEVRNLALMNYHRAILDKAGEALEDQKAKEREYGAILVATTEEKYLRFKRRLKEFRREALEMLDTPDGEATRVANFSFQLFLAVDDVEAPPAPAPNKVDAP